MAGNPPDPQHQDVAVEITRRPGEEAAEAALAQLDFGEAPQIGLLGDTGTGKTTAAQYLIRAYLRRSPGSVLIVDDKEMSPRFEGQLRRDVEDLREHPVDFQQGRVIVFRGEP